jgi:hypothetical protein
MKIKKIPTVLLLILILCAGCKKDTREASNDNYIKYDGEKYPIDKGVLENFGLYDDSYNLDLSLYSNSVIPIEDEGELIGANGTGNAIYFEMFSSSSTQLTNGSYYFSYSEEAGTYDYGIVHVNYNFNTHVGEIAQYIESGTVTVAKIGDIYEITINCTDEDGKSVTGYYKGTLTWYNSGLIKSTKSNKRKL